MLKHRLWLGGAVLLALMCGLAFAALDRSTAPVAASLSDMEGFASASSTAADDPAEAAVFLKIVQPYLERGVDVPESIFEQYYDSYGPQLMLDVMNQDPTCHVAAHNLGRVIYAHTNDLVSSLAICENKCNQGCIHGVLMGMFHTPDNNDPSVSSITPAITQKIAETCDDRAISIYLQKGECYHAIGHVVDAFAENDLKTATALCDSIFAHRTPAARYFCATGVYMQQSLTVDTQPAASSTGLTPCNTNEYPAACYRFYLYRAFPGSSGYAQANLYCSSLAGSQRLACFSAVGADWVSLVHHDRTDLNLLCGTGTDTDKQMCLEGVLELLNVYYSGESWQACSTYVVGSSSMCRNATYHGNLDVTRDLSLYLH